MIESPPADAEEAINFLLDPKANFKGLSIANILTLAAIADNQTIPGQTRRTFSFDRFIASDLFNCKLKEDQKHIDFSDTASLFECDFFKNRTVVISSASGLVEILSKNGQAAVLLDAIGKRNADEQVASLTTDAAWCLFEAENEKGWQMVQQLPLGTQQTQVMATEWVIWAAACNNRPIAAQMLDKISVSPQDQQAPILAQHDVALSLANSPRAARKLADMISALPYLHQRFDALDADDAIYAFVKHGQIKAVDGIIKDLPRRMQSGLWAKIEEAEKWLAEEGTASRDYPIATRQTITSKGDTAHFKDIAAAHLHRLPGQKTR